jgi:parallel beta-helix repeat protein
MPANNGLARVQESTGRGPLDSLQSALITLRVLKSARSAPEADRIVLLAGEYRLSAPVLITAQDNGVSADKPLLIEAESPGAAVLLGSRRVGGFRMAEGKPYVVTSVDLPRGFHELWINGAWAQRARSPNGKAFYSGAANVVTPVPGDRLRNPRYPQNVINTSQVVLPKAAQVALNTVQNPAQGGVLLAMHSWTSSHHQIESWNSNTGVVAVKPVSLWSFLKFGPDQRFALENLPEFLDAPGEWWSAPSGELRYILRQGESVDSLTAEVPQQERLLELRGTEREPVQHVQIKGLRFSHASAWVVPFIDSQAATGVPSAVQVENARSFLFDRCAFENLGGHGVWLRRGSRDGEIRHSAFRRLGAGGIRVGEMEFGTDGALSVGGHHIHDNVIEDTGLLFPGAVGIWIGQSGNNVVAHNVVQRTTYSGISVGWTWGFGGSNARGNILEGNLLKQIGQGRLSDLGGIYTLGISPGTAIRGNRIEDVRSFKQSGATAWGIYLDEGSSQIAIERNWVAGSTGGGVHLHYGNDNSVRNNVFGEGEIAQIRRSKKLDSSLIFERNVLLAGDRPVWEREWQDEGVHSDGNVIWQSKPKNSSGGVAATLSGLRAKGKEKHSISLGKRPPNCEPAGCELPASVLKQTGFVPFNVKGAGVRQQGLVPPDTVSPKFD